MKRIFQIVFSLAFALTLCSRSVSAMDWAHSFDELSDLRWLALKSCFSTHQFSSFDRTGGNADCGHFLSVEGNRAVLADMKGPGEIVRIWSANPSGIIKVFLDGNTQPFVNGPFPDMFTGQLTPFSHPLSVTSSGGGISYFPVPYRTAARVEVENVVPFYYQVTYRTFCASDGTPDVAATMKQSESQAYGRAQAAWRQPGPLRVALSGSDPIVPSGGTRKQSKRSITLRPGKTVKIAALSGGGYIYDLRIMPPLSEPAALRKTRLLIRWDNSPRAGVDVPLLDLFGSAFGLKDFRSLAIGRASDGWWYLRLPMPFKRRADVLLINQSMKSLRMHVCVSWVQGGISRDALYYRTTFTTQTTVAGRPYPILRADGQGQFVGCSISMQGTGGLGFLEGDELVSVDGRPTTDFNGTGTEDYFNSGWYFRDGPVSQPLHGCIVKDDALSRISVYRFHDTDRIPFVKNIRFEMEHGGVNDAPGCIYSSVAHWYSANAGDRSTLIVNATALNIPHRKLIPPPGSIALASLPLIELSGGKLSKADWRDISDTIEGAGLVVFRPKQIGNAYTKRLYVPFGDLCSLAFWVAKGPGMGKMRVMVDEQQVGEIDLWSPEANHPERIALGQIKLSRGAHNLRIQCCGRSPASAGMTIVLSHVDIGSGSKFVPAWSVTGPFNTQDGKVFDTAFINEQTTAFAPGTENWKAIVAQNGAVLLSDKPDSAWYARAIIVAGRDLDTEMMIGSDDGIKAWLNGRLVHSNNTVRSLLADTDRVRVRLNEGDNLLLLKITNAQGPCAFTARLRDPGDVFSYPPPPEKSK